MTKEAQIVMVSHLFTMLGKFFNTKHFPFLIVFATYSILIYKFFSGNGVLSIIEVLLDRNANATLKNDLGDTPLQTLEKWRKERTLNPTEQNYYQTVHRRLSQQLEKAGIDIVHDSPAKPKSCTGNSASSSNSLSSLKLKVTPRKRIISESTSSEDEEIKLYNSEGLETIDKILDDEFPRVDSPIPSSPDSVPKITLSPNRVNYREVMNDLRYGNFQNKIDSTVGPIKSVQRIEKKSAMLGVNEVSNDDWLDNDLAPSTKRRKYLKESWNSNDSNISNGRKSKSKFFHSRSLSNDATVSSTNAIMSIDDSDDENDAFNVLMNSDQTAMRRKKRLSTSGTTRLSGDSNTLQQSSLIESGFSRHRVTSPETSLLSVSSTVLSPNKSTNSGPPTTTPQSHSIKVQVSDLYLNIPVNINNANDLTMEWFAEEAAKRYYR